MHNSTNKFNCAVLREHCICTFSYPYRYWMDIMANIKAMSYPYDLLAKLCRNFTSF